MTNKLFTINRLLIVAVSVTGVAMLWMAYQQYQSHLADVSAQQRQMKLTELRGTIVYLDEVLTISAQAASMTGDPQWETRYRHFDPMFNAAMKETAELAPSAFSVEAASKREAATVKLLEMESQAFDLIRSNRLSEARSLLFSDDYQQQKRLYAGEIAQLTTELQAVIEASSRSSQNNAVKDALLTGGMALFLLTGWVIVLLLTRHWQTALDEANRGQARYAKDLAELNEGLDEKISLRTKDLQASRRAALNMLEDAVEARNTAETVNQELKEQIARRRQTEAKLVDSEGNYRDLVENAHDMIYTRDMDANITSVNAAGENITGYTREEFLQMNMRQIIAADDWERLKSIAAGNLPRMEGTADEMDILAKDGRRITLEVNTTLIHRDGLAVGVQGIARDITERRMVEKQLIKSEERYRDLVENAHDIIYSHDLAGNYTSMNAAGERITGYTHAEAMRISIMDTVAPDQLERAKEMISRKLKGEKVAAYELDILAKDGRRVTVEVNTKLVVQNGVPVGIQGIARDITERQLLEEQLRQSQKLESVGRLAGGIAHDFNNMLTAINGYSELALRQIDNDDPIRGHIEEVKKAGDRAASLTNQLLAFSRKQVLHPEVVQINDIISETSKMLTRLIGEDVELITKLKPNVGMILADPGQLGQIIMNLAVNARDAMPNGGKLTIETTNTFLDPEYASKHVGILPGAYVMVTVSDTGTGMEPGLIDQIFEPFFTTKEMGKGTGLGLATVYGIVKQSGGGIFVYSEVGLGTTFKVYLPRVADETELVGAAEDQPVKFAVGTETILLVEDEEMVRSLSRQILESCGYTVIEARDGVEALEIFESGDVEVDLLLTDAVMPRMGGRELIDNVLASRPTLRALLASGYSDDTLVHQGLADEHVAFIQKPFSPEGLARSVRDLLDESAGK